jgi:glycosyltransferase involved in cell wall biosynthesis
MNLNNVIFIPRQPFSEIGKIMNLADVLLVHLIDETLFRMTIPSKIQTYLAIGKPILVGVRGDASDLVQRAQAGIPFIPQNVSSLVDSITKLRSMTPQDLQEMADNGKSFYHKHMSISIAAKKYEKLFESVVKQPTRG